MTQTASRPQALTLPGPSRNGWTIDPRAVRDAIDVLGVTRPVEIKLSQGIHRVGCARVRDGVHVITVTTHHTAPDASETIWHELTHAAQRDRIGTDHAADVAFADAYRRESALHGYRGNAFEVEARDTAATMSPDFPLVRGGYGRNRIA